MKKVLLRVFALCSAAWLCVGGAKADVAPVEPSTVDGVYQIGSAAHLVWFSDYVNAGNNTAQAVLTADINMSEVESFTPIGKTAHSGTYNSNDLAFKGVFDGQGHTISNLSVSMDATQPWQAGLFGRITNATVRNLALQTVSITQTSGTAAAAGALAGRNGSSTVTNCCAVDVSFTQKKKSSSGSSATSGLVGYMSDAVASQMINCYTDYPTLTILGAKATITNSYCDVDVATKAATGELCYLLGAAFRQNIGEDGYPVLDSTHGIVNKISAAGYATQYIADTDVEIPAGVKAYTGKVNGDNLTLTEVADKIPAATAVVLEGAAGYYSFVPTTGAAAVAENDLKGAATDLAADGSQYVLAKKDDVVGFYQATSGTIAAGKAYLTGISAGVKAVTFGTTTSLTPALSEERETVIYDLAGRRVEKATKGLYIINGKKVLK